MPGNPDTLALRKQHVGDVVREKRNAEMTKKNSSWVHLAEQKRWLRGMIPQPLADVLHASLCGEDGKNQTGHDQNLGDDWPEKEETE